YADRRYRYHPGLRVIGSAQHGGRFPSGFRDARSDVLAQLALCTDCRGLRANPIAAGGTFQEISQATDPRTTPEAERRTRRSAAGARVNPSSGRLKGAIQFDHVSFSYVPGAPVLKQVNLSIDAGQFVGLVGPTGSGKSTVASMIARFYDPISGSVRIDGVDIRDYKLQGLRDKIAFVLQDTVLFSTTLRDNIAYGRPDATDDQIIAAAKLARADEFIIRMANGYDTVLGERGVTLS